MSTSSKISVWISLSVLLLSWDSIAARNTPSRLDRALKNFKRFNHPQARLPNNARENFNRALNFVTNYSEFRPLFLSIGSLGLPGDILARVTKNLAERTMDYYRFDLSSLDDSKINLQSGLTWIIVVDNYEALDRYSRDNLYFWTSAKQFFIIFVGEMSDRRLRRSDWSDIFNRLWSRHKVCKVLITSVQENFTYLYRFMPFEKVGEEFGSIQRLDVRDALHTSPDEPDGCRPIFEDFENFNGYPIYVTVFQSVMMNITEGKNNKTSYSLLDANVMNLIEDRLGSKFEINVIDSEKAGDPFTEALGTIEPENISDIVFTAYFAKRYVKTVTFTASIFQDKVCLIGPSSEPIPKYFMPLLPFSDDLWIILFIYNLVIAILWLLVQRLQLKMRCLATVSLPIKIRVHAPRTSKPRGIERLGMNRGTLVPVHYSRVYKEPRKIHPCIVGAFDLFTLACYPLSGGKTCTERAFLFGTLFFGLIVVGLYQSYLVSSLSKPLFYPELNTLSDVLESNRTIITKYKNLQRDTFTQGTPVTDALQKKIEVSTSQEKTYDLVAYRGFISIGRFSSFQLENLTHYYNTETNKLRLHIVEECPATSPLSYPARSFSPYLPRIDSLLLRIQQSGFVEKWYGDMLLRAKILRTKSIPDWNNEPVKLTLVHLFLTFFILVVGLFCSTLVFLGELYYARK